MNLILKLKHILTWVLFLIPIFSYSQTTTVQGNAKSYENLALVSAIVKLNEFNTNQTKHYTVTDANGQFSMKNVEYGQYILTIREILHQPFQDTITVNAQSNTFSYQLKEDKNIIDDVIVETKGETVIRKGDTLVVNHNYYMLGNEQNLRDVLEKTPGFDVEGNQISYQGKPIHKVLLEQKDVFNYDKSLVLDSVNPNDIENLQVIENYRTKAEQLKTDKSNKIALNVNLKKEALKLRGKIKAGIGNKHYEFEPSAYSITPTTGLTVFLKSNNLAEQAISQSDVLASYNKLSDVTDFNNLIPDELKHSISNKGNAHVLVGNLDKHISNRLKVNSAILANYSSFQQDAISNQINLLTQQESKFENETKRKLPYLSLKNRIDYELDSITVFDFNYNVLAFDGETKQAGNNANSRFQNKHISHQLIANAVRKFTSSFNASIHTDMSFPEVQRSRFIQQEENLFSEIRAEDSNTISQKQTEATKNHLVRLQLAKTFPKDLKMRLSFSNNTINFNRKSIGEPEFLNQVDVKQHQQLAGIRIKKKWNQLSAETNSGFQQNQLHALTKTSFQNLKSDTKIKYKFSPMKRVWLGYKQNSFFLPIDQTGDFYQIQERNRLVFNQHYNQQKASEQSTYFGYHAGKFPQSSMFNINYSYAVKTNQLFQEIESYANYIVEKRDIAKQIKTHSLKLHWLNEYLLFKQRASLRLLASYNKNDIASRNLKQDNILVNLSNTFRFGEQFYLKPKINFRYFKSTRQNTTETTLYSPHLSAQFKQDKLSIKSAISYSKTLRKSNSFTSKPSIDTEINYDLKKGLSAYLKAKDVSNFDGNTLQTIQFSDTYYQLTTAQQRAGYFLIGMSKTF